MISLRQPLSVTLDNIDRLQAAISKQPLARRPPFSEREYPCPGICASHTVQLHSFVSLRIKRFISSLISPFHTTASCLRQCPARRSTAPTTRNATNIRARPRAGVPILARTTPTLKPSAARTTPRIRHIAVYGSIPAGVPSASGYCGLGPATPRGMHTFIRSR